ncbi:MAG: permease [Planctomycetes bacterium]|nr:permease [Planctomycetota bacterium]MBU4400436.1 permease [Planctomycetota bacterium]MCG2684040.1 PfkB family carbohydrate kinase [Planctomycetales bacterium]
MHKSFDILGLGSTAVDELLYVDAYPAADAKVPVRRRERHCGGLTATALVAAARMGCRCAYAGTLGDDEQSQFVLQRFREEGIDVTHLRRRPDARPIHSTVIVDQGGQTRTILYDLNGMVGADSNWPQDGLIRAARVLFVDHCGVEGMIRATRVARDARIPVVADFESAEDPLFPELLGLVDHLVLSRDFALEASGQTEPAAAARELWAPERRAVVVTCGREGCWYVTDQQPGVSRRQPALDIEAVDTTGCGDVFHGAYAAALVHGLDVPGAVRFASVAAGLKATRRGGQAGIPTRAAVERQMAKAFPDHSKHVEHRTVQNT